MFNRKSDTNIHTIGQLVEIEWTNERELCNANDIASVIGWSDAECFPKILHIFVL